MTAGRHGHQAPAGFDLDMTLIDSRRVILASFGAVSDATGVPIDPAAVDRRLGIKLEDELGFWFPAEQVPAAVRVYREHYLRLAEPLTSALPGAREALAAVRAIAANMSLRMVISFAPKSASSLFRLYNAEKVQPFTLP